MKGFKSLLLGAAFGLLFYGCCLAPGPATHSKIDDGVRYYRSTVMLQMFDKEGDNSILATGFAIDRSHIVTAAHYCVALVEGPLLEELNGNLQIVYLNNNDELSTLDKAEVVELDEERDLCIVKKGKHGIVPLRLEKKYWKNVKVGDSVTIVGAPLGIFPLRTEGWVVNKDFESASEELDGTLIVSAPIAPGNSGGPVIGKDGKVIGVAVMGTSRYSQIAIATPVYQLIRFLRECDLIKW